MLTPFAYHRPKVPEGVDKLLADLSPGVRVLAGGTDLVVQIRNGIEQATAVVDITHIDELREIEELPDGRVRIGAGVTMTQLRDHPVIQANYQALIEGAAEVGSHQIQNRATLVGNLCNASPAADTLPALFIHDATVNVSAAHAERHVPVKRFITGPRHTVLGRGEWVASIDLGPRLTASTYLKLGRTPGVDLAVVGVACGILDGRVQLALASVAPTVLSPTEAEDILSHSLDKREFPPDAGGAVEDAIEPIDDVRASAQYRREMAHVLVRRAWSIALQRMPTDG